MKDWIISGFSVKQNEAHSNSSDYLVPVNSRASL